MLINSDFQAASDIDSRKKELDEILAEIPEKCGEKNALKSKAYNSCVETAKTKAQTDFDEFKQTLEKSREPGNIDEKVGNLNCVFPFKPVAKKIIVFVPTFDTKVTDHLYLWCFFSSEKFRIFKLGPFLTEFLYIIQTVLLS